MNDKEFLNSIRDSIDGDYAHKITDDEIDRFTKIINGMKEIKKYKGATCRGSYSLGTACGNCEKCLDYSLLHNAPFGVMPKIKLPPKEIYSNQDHSPYRLTRKDEIAIEILKLADYTELSTNTINRVFDITETFIKRSDCEKS